MFLNNNQYTHKSLILNCSVIQYKQQKIGMGWLEQIRYFD